MKKLLTIISAAVALAAFAPTEAKADHCSRRFVGYDHCGNAIYAVAYFAGYDCHGCPVYRWRNETVCRPRHYDPCHSGYGYRHYPHHRNGHHGFSIHSPGVHLSFGRGRGW